MKLYLIRHGETVSNATHTTQGWTDVRLSPKGEEQAIKLGERIAKLNFDKIYSSDLYRTKQTLKLVFGGKADGVIFDERLREINNTVFAGRTSKELFKEYGDRYLESARRFDYGEYGGESQEAFLARTASFLADMEKYPTDAKIAAVTHGGTSRAFIANVLKMPLVTYNIEIKNCTVTVLSFDEGRWTVKHINNKSEF